MGFITDIISTANDSFDLIKARTEYKSPGIVSHPFFRDMRGMGPEHALLIDPNLYGFAGAMYREKPISINYALCNHIFRRDPVISAIILRRLNQVVGFCYPKTHDEATRTIGTGFRCVLKPGASKKRTKAVEKKEDDLNQTINHCADPDTPIHDRIEKTFDRFVWKFTQDRLVLDQPCAVIEESKKGKLRQFFAVDGSTIRLTSAIPEVQKQYGPYCQVYNGMIVSSFDDDHMMFCAQNVSSELARFGYGCSELEFIVRLLIAHMGITASNERMFQPHSMPKGLLVAEMIEITPENMKQLETHWFNMMAQARSKHRIPVIGMPKGGRMSFISLPQATDMEYARNGPVGRRRSMQ